MIQLLGKPLHILTFNKSNSVLADFISLDVRQKVHEFGRKIQQYCGRKTRVSAGFFLEGIQEGEWAIVLGGGGCKCPFRTPLLTPMAKDELGSEKLL